MAMVEGGLHHRVCAAAPYGVEVAWLAMNQKVIVYHIHESQPLTRQIPISEQWKYPRPQSWYEHDELHSLVRISKALDKFCQVGRSYVLKNESDYERKFTSSRALEIVPS